MKGHYFLNFAMFPLFDENRVSLWLSFPPYYGEFLIVKIMSENEREIK